MTVISHKSGNDLSTRGRPSGYVLDRHTTVYCVNESPALESPEFADLVWSLQYQVDYQFGPAWGIAARVVASPPGATVAKGAIGLHFVDTLDVQGALGYHDEDGNEVPFAKIGVVTSRQDGAATSAVASHELCELLVNLHVNLTVVNPKTLQVVGYEVGDPCQGADYDVGTPDRRPTSKAGGMVADFALPNWFDPQTNSRAKTSYRGTCRGPFSVAPHGYHGYIDLNDAVSGGQPNWQEAFGQDHVRTGDPPVKNPQ